MENIFANPNCKTADQGPTPSKESDKIVVRHCMLACLMSEQCRYVDFDLAEETAGFVGSMRKWVTNEYMHSGIREDGIRILDRLMGMTRNSRPLN